ncbi:DUF4097 family beta strand repeat-containing protein [Pseudoxanthomonas sp.]|uniref:DUF4097 family beta strand repeat-containing protein n=1 Tax=Pseudoxanthomonas sp. TaxID=1871049 RepID=UPI0026287ED7|nr:DUF4097 family beta strand repeat-containing protein [Pseudoxanthomonas sp.]WDS37566.1 MAG: DUF4097 family beta strand repeat-containing protein [Pseudoxanthomonas sp.]
MRTILAAVPLLLMALSAQAATPIDQTRPLDPRGKVEVENIKGRIQVRAWDRSEVQIRGTLGDGVEKLEVEGDGDDLQIKVRYPKGGGWGGKSSGPTDLQLMVPVRASLDLHAVSADVDVSGVAPDELSIESVSGSVVVAAAPRELSINSVSGDVTATANSGEVDIQTVSGSVILRGRLNGEVEVETVSGDINVAVKDERLRELSTNSVSGRTRVATGLARNGKVSLSSVSGGVVLTLPRDLSAHVTAETFSGDLKAPNATIERPEHGPGRSLDTRYGNGEGEIKLETFSGDAELRLE